MASNLEILLDSRTEPAYSAGDRISGKVRFTTTKDVEIGAVRLKFLGRSKTKLTTSGKNRSTYRGRNIFFEKDLVLYKGHYKHHAPDYEWPFEFRFPLVAERVAQSDSWDEGDSRFFDSNRYAEIELPSTMSVENEGFATTSFDARVEYRLEASLSRPDAMHSGIEAGKAIPFMQTSKRPESGSKPSPRPYTASEPFQVQSYKVDPKYEGHELTFKEKMKSGFKTSGVPIAAFKLHVEVPTVTQSNENIHLKLVLEYVENRDGTTFMPPVSLTSSEFSIRAVTNVRSAREVIRMIDSSTEDKLQSGKMVLTTRAPWIGLFSKENDYSKMVVFDDMSLMRHIAPTFKTCNICRTYLLKIHFGLECAGEKFSFKKHIQLLILPPFKKEDELPAYTPKNGMPSSAEPQ